MLPLPSLIKCQPYQGWPAGGPWENCGRRFNSVFPKFMCKFYILDKQPSKELICIVHKYSSVRSMNSVINLGYDPFSGVYFSVETPAEQPHTINDIKRLFKSAGGKKLTYLALYVLPSAKTHSLHFKVILWTSTCWKRAKTRSKVFKKT